VGTDQDKIHLELVIHWKVRRAYATRDGTTTFRSGNGHAHGGAGDHSSHGCSIGDDQIASVLNRRGYSTGKGKCGGNQTRVATARRNHSIAGQKRALHDPERVSLSEAARICGVSPPHHPKAGIEAGLLKREQITSRAPWEVSRRDLDAETIRSGY